MIESFDQRLMDSTFGIVHSVRKVQSNIPAPSSFHCYTAQPSDITIIEPDWRVDKIGSGSSFSEENAIKQAIGEAIERYAGNILPREPLAISIGDAIASDRFILNPIDFPFYSVSQRNKLKDIFSAPTESNIVHWFQSTEYHQGASREIYVPLELTHLKYDPARLGLRRNRFFPLIYAGIAAHTNRVDAFASAFHEVVERHHTFLWWYGGQPATLSSDREFPNSEVILKELQEHYVISIFIIGTHEFGMTVGCALERRTSGDLLIGFSSKSTYEEAAPKAICEALQLHEFLTKLKEKDSWIWKAWKRGDISRKALTDGVVDDQQVSESLMWNLQFYIGAGTFVRGKAHLQTILRPKPARSDFQATIRPKPTPESVSDAGYRVIVADLTSPDVRQIGMHVLRVIVPGFVTNTAHALIQDAHPAWGELSYAGLTAVPPLPHA